MACAITDLKSVIALSSVRHIGVGIRCFFVGGGGPERFIILIVSHSFISSGIFYLCGQISEKVNGRRILSLKSCQQRRFIFLIG